MSDPGFLADVMENGPKEAKELLQRLAFYTHVGYEAMTGYVHGPRLFGHADYRGKSHALNGSATAYEGALYRSLCGRTIRADEDMQHGCLSVRKADDENGSGVSCKRCRRAIEKQKR
jgi:hypothetical protein